MRITAPDDWVATSTENEPLESAFLATPNTTSSRMPAQRIIKRVMRRTGSRALRLREHMPAKALRSLVGSNVWSNYRKISVVRDPWHRLLSLWRWRTRRDGLTADFEQFLRAIEAGSRGMEKSVGARRWSNLPFYAIDNQLILNHVLRFETLTEDFSLMVRDYDLPDPGVLPYLKVTQRLGEDLSRYLNADQVARIAALCSREIEWFGYSMPDVS